MDSSPASIPVLPPLQTGGAWPTFVANPADRRALGPMALADGASGAIMGSSPMGRPAGPSRTIGNVPTTGVGSKPPTSSPPMTAQVAQATPAQPVTTSGPAAQPAVIRRVPAPAPKQTAAPVVPAAHVVAPVPTPALVPGAIHRQVPAPGARPPTMPPAFVPAAPTRGMAPMPAMPRVATRVATIGQASPREERKASLALTFGILAIIVPLVIVGAVPLLANAAAVILGIVAIVFARQALGAKALNRAAHTRAGWSLAIGIIVMLVWIIALTQGV